jgi:ribosomal protein S18 acetylase RimI-like enzyme
MRIEDLKFRPIEWRKDRRAIIELDASFRTERVYRVEISGLSARLVEERLARPRVKRYDLRDIGVAVKDADVTVAAEAEGELAGFMTVKYERWNRRVWLTHLYIGPKFRFQGLGTEMVGRAVNFAKRKKARGVWLETQNFNYPAIRFYRRHGFEFCGFDRSLYDPAVVPGETAIFFAREF